jgi:peptidoglycan lytic transglycosylase G
VRKLLGIFFFVILLAVGWFLWALLIPVTPPARTFVMLRPGYSTRRIAAELKSAGVIRSERAFIFWHYLHHRRSLKAGEYLFEKPASVRDIHRRLARSEVYFHTVVVPEGYTIFDIAHAIESAGLGSADEFVRAAKSDTTLISDLAPDATSLEGYLFPETYEFTRMMSMQDMAAAMVKQFRQVARQVGLIPGGPTDSQNSSEAQTPTQDNNIAQTVIMASIVEKETAVPEERPLVASVYYNRLARKIALDADPSIIYAELLAGSYQGALHHEDMRFNSRYNTYRFAGLPPGPIGNPGKSALEAAMHPARTDYLYFVADAAGHHRFARTMEEHNRNVAAYRKAMRGR